MSPFSLNLLTQLNYDDHWWLSPLHFNGLMLWHRYDDAWVHLHFCVKLGNPNNNKLLISDSVFLIRRVIIYRNSRCQMSRSKRYKKKPSAFTHAITFIESAWTDLNEMNIFRKKTKQLICTQHRINCEWKRTVATTESTIENNHSQVDASIRSCHWIRTKMNNLR